jgi:hypothetical protein
MGPKWNQPHCRLSSAFTTLPSTRLTRAASWPSVIMGLLSILKRGAQTPPLAPLDEKHDEPENISPSPSSSTFNSKSEDSSDPSRINSSSSDFALDKYGNAKPHRPRPSFRQSTSGHGTSSYVTEHGNDSYESEVDDECLELPSSPGSPKSPRQPRQPKTRDATEMMADSIYRRASVWHQWFTPPSAGGVYGNVSTGVALRAKDGKHILYPHACPGLQDFGWAISHLNPAVCILFPLFGA